MFYTKNIILLPLTDVADAHSRPQSLLSLLAGGAFAQGKGGSGDTGFDWLVS